MKLLATDLEVGLRSRCAASVSKSGSLTLPAKKLYEIIKALPETDVRIEEDKSGVKVAADRFDSRMQTLPREDFPTLPDGTGVYSATLPRDVLKHMVAKTQFAITGEDTRYFLNGALFILRPDSMSLVSTDGHRLALITVPRDKASVKGNAGGRGPRDPSAEDAPRARPAARRGGRRNSVRARREPPVLRSRRAAADLADDRRPVPRVRARDPEGERQAGRVRPRSPDERRQARRAAVERAVARGEVPDRQGQGRDRVEQPGVRRSQGNPDRRVRGAPVTICFNAQYVLDFLSVVETDSVALEFKDEMSQAVMKPIGAEGYDYTYVIMPMRV